MSKRSYIRDVQNGQTCTLMFGKYNELFECLKVGVVRNLKDKKSDKNTSLPIRVCEENVYVTEPDGKFIPSISGQKKCDYLLYCQNRPQVCFFELKGANISIKKTYNPYDQIIDTINFMEQEVELKGLVNGKVEKHAFIVSPGRQKIPKGVDTKERQLWRKLAQNGKRTNIFDLVHYVKVTKKDRYSNTEHIICSPSSPIEMPFDI